MPAIKHLLIVFLVALVATYAIAFTKNVAFFYLFLASTTYVTLLLAYLVLFKSLWKKFNPDIEKRCEERKKLLWAAILICFLLFLIGWTIVSYLVQIKILRFFGILTVFFLSIWLPDIVLSPTKKKLAKFILFAVVFSLFLFFFKSSTTRFSSTAEISSEGKLEKLKSLPYLTWVPAEDSLKYSGVVRYDEENTFEGINIFNSRSSTVVQLMDMQGNLLHSWSPEIKEKEEGFHHIQIDKDGGVLAIVEEKYIVCFDWNSKIQWRRNERAHHDIALAENTDIYFLARKDEIVWANYLPIPILNDYIKVYSHEGRKKKEISLFDALESEMSLKLLLKTYYNALIPGRLLATIRNKLRRKETSYWFTESSVQDVLHTNSIHVIDRDIPGLCKKDDILISSRGLNLIALIDTANEKTIWAWGPGNLIEQHHATLLENNDILVFDNGDIDRRNYSRIIELNPLTKQIVWEYKSNPPDKFFSVSRGACQRLPNGNTLITNSDSGHVFEVTKSGEVVWEFYSPDLDIREKKRAAIYRFIRIVNAGEYPIFATLK